MAVENVLKVYPGQAAAATTKGYLGAFDSNGKIAVATVAGQKCDGVLTETVDAAGEAVGLKIGIVEVIAGEAISAGDTVSCTAAGKAQVWATGEYAVGKALSAASTDGDRIKVLSFSPRMDGNFIKVGTIAVTGFTSTGVKASWQNPEGARIVVHSCQFDRTTAATGANTADIGTTAVSAATTSDNLFDGLNTNATAGTNSNLPAADAGTNGRPAPFLPSGQGGHHATGRATVGRLGSDGDAHTVMAAYHRVLAQGVDAAEALEIASAGVEEGRLFCAYGADWSAAPAGAHGGAPAAVLRIEGTAKSPS